MEKDHDIIITTTTTFFVVRQRRLGQLDGRYTSPNGLKPRPLLISCYSSWYNHHPHIFFSFYMLLYNYSCSFFAFKTKTRQKISFWLYFKKAKSGYLCFLNKKITKLFQWNCYTKFCFMNVWLFRTIFDLKLYTSQCAFHNCYIIW